MAWPTNQSIEHPVGANVYGSAVLRTEPDRAVAEIGVVRVASTAKAAFSETGKATDAVEAGANEVTSVKYLTTQLAELRAQARREAVAAARRKAEVYSEAAGVALGHVLHIEDVNPDSMV